MIWEVRSDPPAWLHVSIQVFSQLTHGTKGTKGSCVLLRLPEDEWWGDDYASKSWHFQLPFSFIHKSKITQWLSPSDIFIIVSLSLLSLQHRIPLFLPGSYTVKSCHVWWNICSPTCKPRDNKQHHSLSLENGTFLLRFKTYTFHLTVWVAVWIPPPAPCFSIVWVVLLMTGKE